MLADIKITDSVSTTVIDIEGIIGVPEEWQFDEPESRVATYRKFKDTVGSIAAIHTPEVIVNIRSTGGDVGDALLIYDALSSLDAQITTRCWGYVASAATIIAQAADEGLREISANALYLIHRSVCQTEGNAAELEAQTELLRKTDVRIAEIYAKRAGRGAEFFDTLMDCNGGKGRWLSPDEVVDSGLADRIIEPSESQAVVNEHKPTFSERLKRITDYFAHRATPAPEDSEQFERQRKTEEQRLTELAACADSALSPTETLSAQKYVDSHLDEVEEAIEKELGKE